MRCLWRRIASLCGLLILSTGVSLAQQPAKATSTLRVALDGDLTFMNAHQGPAPGYTTLWVWNNIFNSLLSMTPPPELKVVPELATSWDVQDDGKTHIFHLVQGVKFHDGTEFNAEAAKWNFDRILNPEVNAWIRPFYEDIAAVEVVDTYTLRVRTKHPAADLPIALAGYFQGIPMSSPKPLETHGKDWVRHPSGTGPFKLKEWVPGKHVILEKNPDYFKKGLPLVDTVELRVMKDPLAAATALRTGEIDLIARVPVRLVPVLEKSPDVTVVTGPDMAPTVAFINMRVKPFDNVEVRRAVGGFGIDRAEVAKVAFQGRTTPLVSVLPRGVPDAVDLNEMYPYNPEKAKQLLQAQGFHERNPVPLTILVPNHDTTLADVATLIKNQLVKIGVDVKINLLDTTAVIERVLVKKDFEMVVSSWGSLLDINMRSVSFFKGRQSDYMGMDDAALEAMIYKWRQTLDPQGRRQVSADIQRHVAEQVYWVNVTGYPFFQAYRKQVKGFAFYDQAYFFLEKTHIDK